MTHTVHAPADNATAVASALPQVSALLAPLSLPVPNEQRLQELHKLAARKIMPATPGPGAYNVYSSNMRPTRASHHRPHNPAIDGPFPLAPGQLSTRARSMLPISCTSATTCHHNSSSNSSSNPPRGPGNHSSSSAATTPLTTPRWLKQLAAAARTSSAAAGGTRHQPDQTGATSCPSAGQPRRGVKIGTGPRECAEHATRVTFGLSMSRALSAGLNWSTPVRKEDALAQLARHQLLLLQEREEAAQADAEEHTIDMAEHEGLEGDAAMCGWQGISQEHDNNQHHHHFRQQKQHHQQQHHSRTQQHHQQHQHRTQQQQQQHQHQQGQSRAQAPVEEQRPHAVSSRLSSAGHWSDSHATPDSSNTQQQQQPTEAAAAAGGSRGTPGPSPQPPSRPCTAGPCNTTTTSSSSSSSRVGTATGRSQSATAAGPAAHQSAHKHIMQLSIGCSAGPSVGRSRSPQLWIHNLPAGTHHRQGSPTSSSSAAAAGGGGGGGGCLGGVHCQEMALLRQQREEQRRLAAAEAADAVVEQQVRRQRWHQLQHVAPPSQDAAVICSFLQQGSGSAAR